MSALALAFALGPIQAAVALAETAGAVLLPVSARTIDRFKVGSDETRFGVLEFIGGLELTSTSSALGAMSAIRLAADRSAFIGVMDTGHWYAGRILRDPSGKLAGIADFSVAPILGADGQTSPEKWLFDSEGLAIRGDKAYVSYERQHRIEVYSAVNPAASLPLGQVSLPIPSAEFRSNRGLETIAAAPEGTPLNGALVAVSERSLDPEGNILAAVLEGPLRGVFSVRRTPPFDVTDGDFLPDGDLLLLERRYSIAGGIGMRIRRIPGEDIRPGVTVTGDVILESDFGNQIDNMEGLDVSVDAGGRIYVVLVSDDNHSILQRNLILEFRFTDEMAPNP